MGLIFPVYIPTKARAESCSTARLLSASAVPFRLAVEPQDEAAYRRSFASAEFLVLPGNDRGLPFARNAILDHARAAGFDWFWMMDDDISRFFAARGKKCVPGDPGEILEAASAVIGRSPGIAQAALEYQQFAWSAGGKVASNSYCDVCVAIHAKRSKGARYRDEVALKEDRDFTLQLLASGWDVARLTRYAFACPKNGTNKGGLAPVYAASGREERASRRMVELWGPDICRFNVKSDGRPDVAINWRFFKRAASRV